MKTLLLILALVVPVSMFTAPVVYSTVKPKASEVECLARNVYHEARGESLEGQIAVAAVTMNRLRSSKFPNSICKVVHQPYQFSWVHQLKSHLPRDKESYKQAKLVALNVIHGYYKDPTYGAVYYHKNTIRPYWLKVVKLTTVIGSHKFYTKRG